MIEDSVDDGGLIQKRRSAKQGARGSYHPPSCPLDATINTSAPCHHVVRERTPFQNRDFQARLGQTCMHERTQFSGLMQGQALELHRRFS